jgi:hypothetical protein
MITVSLSAEKNCCLLKIIFQLQNEIAHNIVVAIITKPK